jgi:hypothetical protein
MMTPFAFSTKCPTLPGKVVEITEKGADGHIDALAKKYLGLDTYPYRQPGEVRVIYRIKPLRYATMG